MKARTVALLRRIHRTASLACAALWLLQAITGVLLVFHWELDDLALRARADPPLDIAAVGAQLTELQQANAQDRVASLYASGGRTGRFDVLIERRDGTTDAVRIDGAGTILRSAPYDHDYFRAGLFQFVTVLHQTLFLHDAGKMFIGVSGVLLLSNLLLGLRLAWPRAGQWRRVLRPPALRGAVATRYGWHRALGLWLAAPAIVLVLVGCLLAFDDTVEAWLGADRASPTLSAAAAPRSVTPADAIATAMARYPGATLASVSLPSDTAPWYRVRVRQANELRRVFGRTSIFVDLRDGRVLLDQAAEDATLGTRIFEALYPLHTGEAGGTAGRVLVLLLGLWLATMIALGLSLWLARRAASAAARAVAPCPTR
ncbi:MAG: hypothetical protein JWM77_2581 [Rhodospirillales bacterium]|nr:hypothetical protein [Rhodospirillales bacterium]